MRPRVERYTGTTAHDNSTRDRPPAIGLVRIVHVHVQLQLNSITQTPLRSNTISTRRFDVHHDVQCCPPMQLFWRCRVPCHRSNRVEDIRASLVRQLHQMSYQRPKRLVKVWFILAKLMELQIYHNRSTLATSDTELRQGTCDFVNVPASQSRENRQPVYHRNSPRLLIRTHWFSSSQNVSHLLLSLIAKL